MGRGGRERGLGFEIRNCVLMWRRSWGMVWCCVRRGWMGCSGSM